MEEMLKPHERLDDLQYRGLRLIQDTRAYCFTSDAVLLANYVRARRQDTVVDLGTGNGAIALLVCAKTGSERVIGIEKQPDAADLARRNVALNGLQSRIRIVTADVAGVSEQLGKASARVVVSNPPYFAAPSGMTRETPQIALARHESTCTLDAWVAEASELLQFGGYCYMIHTVSRMAEVLSAMTAHDLAPKQVTLIYPKADKQADTFIVAAKKGGRHGMRLDRLVVYEADGSMTEQVRKLYADSDQDSDSNTDL